MSKVCQVTGKKMMVGHHVSHSNKKVKRRFYPNVFLRKFYLEEEDRWIQLRVSAKGIRIINKKGLYKALHEAKQNGYIEKF